MKRFSLILFLFFTLSSAFTASSIAADLKIVGVEMKFANGNSATISFEGKIIGVGTAGDSQVRRNFLGKLVGSEEKQVVYGIGDRLESIGGAKLTYDISGRLEKIGDLRIQYEVSGQLKQIGEARIKYGLNSKLEAIEGKLPEGFSIRLSQ